MILFPLGQPIFEKLGPAGISMFYISCIISQLVYSCGGSIFKCGIGSEMVCSPTSTIHTRTHMSADRSGTILPQNGIYNNCNGWRRQPRSSNRNYHHLLCHQLRSYWTRFLPDGNMQVWLPCWLYSQAHIDWMHWGCRMVFDCHWLRGYCPPGRQS